MGARCTESEFGPLRDVLVRRSGTAVAWKLFYGASYLLWPVKKLLYVNGTEAETLRVAVYLYCLQLLL